MYLKLKPMVAALAALSVFPGSLFAAEKDMDPIVVTATRQASRASELLSDVTVIEREEIERAGSVTLPELLARQPGIEYSANGGPGATSSVYLRGGANDKHTVVLVDGVRVGSASSGSFNWSSMPLSQIERVEVLKGSASALYGSDAIGGVIQIFTRQGITPFQVNASTAMGNYGTTDNSAGFSGKTEHFKYSLQLSDYVTEGINNQIDRRNSSFNDDNDGFKLRTTTASVSYRFTQQHELGLNFFQSFGQSRYDSRRTSAPAYPATTDIRSDNLVESVRLFSKNRLATFWNSTISMASSTDDSTVMLGSTPDPVSLFKTEQQQFSWQNDFKTDVGNFLIAADQLTQKLTTATAYSQTQRTIDSVLIGWSHAFGDQSWQANLRRDENSQFGGKNTGSLAYGYHLSPALRSHASIGTAFRAPSFNDLYYPSRTSGGITYVGNQGLAPESSLNREVGITHQSGFQKITLTWFNSQISDLIQWQTAGTTSSPVNVGSARISGQSLSYLSHIHGYDFSANITHQDARNLDDDSYLPRRARDFLTLTLGKQFGRYSWRTELFATDRRYSDATNKQELAGYTIVNLHASYQATREIQAFARINNLFDRTYFTAGSYSTSASSNATYAALGMNFMLGLRYTPQ